MRKREAARIDRARRAYANEKRKFARAESKRTTVPDNTQAAHDLRRASYRARERLDKLRGKLAQAIQAPVRAARADFDNRPTRYRNLRATESAIEKAEILAVKKVRSIRKASLMESEEKAIKLARRLHEQGYSADDVYKKIAREAGISNMAAYTLFLYSGESEASSDGAYAE